MKNRDTSLLHQDPVTFEVVRNGLYSICEEMKGVIMRASFSPLLSLSADLSCAVLDAEGMVAAQGNDIPVHLGAMPFTSRAILEAIPLADWREGDAVLTNDPYCGGTHLPDMTLMSPIFADGRIMAFVASRVHWPDVGGAFAGSSSVTDEIIKEGLRLPPIKIAERGEIRRDVVGIILANVRIPDDRYGDLRAQFAGNLRGVQRLEGIARRYGREIVEQVLRDSQNYSQLQVEAGLASLPDGEASYAEPLDGDGFDSADSQTARIQAAIRKRGREVTFDFAGSSPAVRGPVNAPLAVTASAVYYTLMCLAGSGIPPNSGAHRPARILAPEGTIVNALYPSAVVAANTETSNRLVDVLLGALAKLYPERVPAGSYGSACVYTVGGWDPVRERSFVHYETIGGGMGAVCGGDGPHGLRVHMGNTMNLPVEAMEVGMPVRFRCYELVQDSGGDGEWRGGCGVRKVLEALADGLEVSILGERDRTPAAGVAGGTAGRTARFALVEASGQTRELASKTQVLRLRKGDRVILETAGGGGWGDPAARGPHARQEDTERGYAS